MHVAFTKLYKYIVNIPPHFCCWKEEDTENLLSPLLSSKPRSPRRKKAHMSHIPKHWALFFFLQLSLLRRSTRFTAASTDWLTGLIMAPRSISNSTFTSSSLLAPQEPWEKATSTTPFFHTFIAEMTSNRGSIGFFTVSGHFASYQVSSHHAIWIKRNIKKKFETFQTISASYG